MIPALPLTLKPWLLLGAVAAAFAGGWTVNGWRWEAKHASELQEQIDRRLKDEQAASAKSAELEASLAQIRQNNRDLNRRIANETAKPAYRCVIPPDGMRIRAAAVAGEAPGEHDGSVRPNP